MALPLIAASARGFFRDEGLRVTLRREVSWATVRDKLGAGVYQGAHFLAPLVLAANLGAGSERADLIAPLSLNAHGAAIGVSNALAAAMAGHDSVEPHSASALARVAADRRAAGQPAISFAVVFPYSMHNYMLRYWLAAAGIDPDRDVRIVTAPPTAIAARLKSGEIDGFCVGAPWGAVCEADNGARIVLDSGAFWPGGPDKAFALSRAWAERNQQAALAMTRATLRGALWADAQENRADLIALLAQSGFVGAPPALIARKLDADDPASIRFARAGAAYPSSRHAAWILSQMLRWGQIDHTTDLGPALAAYHPDLFEAAARDIDAPAPDAASGLPVPGDRSLSDSPADLRRYAASFAITRVKA